jgi:gas vesicle protein
MNLASAKMRSFCEDMRVSSEQRKNFIKRLKEQTETIRNNARSFLIESKRFQREMSKELRDNLQGSNKELIKTVSNLREDFKKKHQELRADLSEASRIWSEMKNSLKRRRSPLIRN